MALRARNLDLLRAYLTYREVKIGEHTIRVKIARDATGKILNMHPEYDDCTRVAHKSGLALKEVILDSLKLAQTITDSL